MRPFAKGRVIILFGPAGNRDRTKRELMGEITARLADFVIWVGNVSARPGTPGQSESPQAACSMVMPWHIQETAAAMALEMENSPGIGRDTLDNSPFPTRDFGADGPGRL